MLCDKALDEIVVIPPAVESVMPAADAKLVLMSPVRLPVIMLEEFVILLELMVEALSVERFNGSLVCAVLPIVVIPATVERLMPVPAARLGLMSPSIVPVTLRSPLISTASKLPFSVIIGKRVAGFDKKKFMSIDELRVVPVKFRILFARANEVVSPVLVSSIYNKLVSTVLAFTRDELTVITVATPMLAVALVMFEELVILLELMVEALRVERFNGSVIIPVLVIVVIPDTVASAIPAPAAKLLLISPVRLLQLMV